MAERESREAVVTRLLLRNFTAFEELNLEFGRGINMFIGPNGTGKTHLLKVLYTFVALKDDESFPEKLIRVFLPYANKLGRLARREAGDNNAVVAIRGAGQTGVSLRFRRSSDGQPSDGEILGSEPIGRLGAVFIPVKEMLSNAPGFRSLYSAREVHFEEVYADVIDRAFLPPSRGELETGKQVIMDSIERTIGGKVVSQEETFFLDRTDGPIEFDLLAEGHRKLALLWLLLRNSAISPGPVLLWDEPEANLNPGIIGDVVDILLALQRMDVQIFTATHNYVVLKEFDLRKKETDQVRYFSLYFDEDKRDSVRRQSTDDYTCIRPNAISDAYASLYDRDVARALGGGKP